MAAPGALLAAPVDLAVGRVEIERDVLAGVASQLVVQALCHPRLGALDRANVAAPKQPSQLARGRRRRRLGHRAQRRAGAVGAQLADDRKPRVRRQVRIVGADREPSGARDIVTGVHPQGDAASPSTFHFTTRNLTVKADGKP